MDTLVDTNVLVYRLDPRDPAKQRRATMVLEQGVTAGSMAIAHQSILEFVAALTRPQPRFSGKPLMSLPDALLESERLLEQFEVLYPSEMVLVAALRGVTTYGLAWFDAQIWAMAEVHGIPELLSEDFQHGRHYGRVRAINPFAGADGVQERPASYRPLQNIELLLGGSTSFTPERLGMKSPVIIWS